MFDARLRRTIDPVLDRLAHGLSASGISANVMTALGCLIGIAAAFAVAMGFYGLGLVLIALNRLADGLDGPIARLHGSSAFGGYLDSLADYIFYIAIPLGFAWVSSVNVWPALLLVASFTLTAVSFLALAAIMAGKDMGHGQKAFTYTSGLMEGGETIAFFIVMCLLPYWFPQLAILFALLCLVTVAQRLWLARSLLV
jgi:phosphatidylglycerophosphate synthase